jgi:LuxR family transcriptional regulator, maltose regulon positive regulatory protein
MHERKPASQQTVRVFGQSEQPAYQRTISMREITFTCIVCQQQTTQLRYPGPPPRYCSDACRARHALIANQERVRKQREKRHAARTARNKGASTSAIKQPSTSLLLPLLASKLSPPRLPALLVERNRLLTLLDSGHHQKLTLLQAPAGFGKTTLMTQWIAHRQKLHTSTAQQLAVAWISLDSSDNDPIRFWSSVIAACRTFNASIGQAALTQISHPPRRPFAASPLEAAVAFLINDLHAVREGILILEDYHLIEHERIHETLTFLIEHLPAGLHMVILTRSTPPLPLVRWRAKGNLLEIQGAQLRFSPEETAVFLQQLIPHQLSTEAIHSLHNHLEGWAAGLRLLALSLQGQITPQAVDDYLTQLNVGSTTSRPIQEYFMGEVFSELPEPLQRFLLQTSILSRLSGSLCDAVTDRDDSTHWLEIVERSGFFLEALDNTGEWYRYHALFAETMRTEATRRFGEERLRHLLLHAALWYEAHEMPMEAIEAALAAHESAYAANMIEQLNEEVYVSEYHTLLRWLKQLPESLLRTRPTLCFYYAQTLYVSEDTDITQLKIEEIEALLQMAEEVWRQQGDLQHIGLLYALRTTLALIQNGHARAVEYARLALQYWPLSTEQIDGHINKQQASWIDWRCGCLTALGEEAMQEGHFDKAYQFILDAYTLSLNHADRSFTFILKKQLGEICAELGDLHQSAEYYQQTIVEVHEQKERGEEIMYTASLYGLARLNYEWNQLERAEQLAREVTDHQFSGYLPQWEEEARAYGELIRLLVLHARGEADAAQQQLSYLFVRLQASAIGLKRLIPDVLAWQACLQLREKDFATARRTLGFLSDYEAEMSPLQLQTVQLLRARLLLGRGEIVAALRVLERLLITALMGKHMLRVLEIQLLIALAYAADKQEYRAKQRLHEVLSQARNEGFLRLFLNEGEPLAALLRSLLPSLTEKPLRTYAETILRAFTNPECATGGSPFEPLSSQELRVLSLLAAGSSNPQIAEALIVSVNTVKGHVKNIYRKLNVNNRVQAGEVARSLRLI